METEAIFCPTCRGEHGVICQGNTWHGRIRCRCITCHKTFLAKPSTSHMGNAIEAAIALSLAEHISWRRIQRTLHVSWLTICRVALQSRLGTGSFASTTLSIR
jgi:transposase-like protein